MSDYIAALAAFTQAFPDDPRTPDFQEVRNEAGLYIGISACRTWPPNGKRSIRAI